MSDKYNYYLNLIFSSVKDLNKQQPPESKLKSKKNELLIAEKSNLDSLGLVTLLIIIEDKIKKDLNKKIVLVNDKLISVENTPFKTIDSLARWLVKNVK